MAAFIDELESIIQDRKQQPQEGSYTTSLFENGLDRILRKVGEESGELIIAAKNQDAVEVKEECADLIYHVLVMLAQQGISFSEVEAVLKARHAKK